MSGSTLSWTKEHMDGVLRIVIAGAGKPGSSGNQDGELMRAVIQNALAEAKPTELVLDLSRLEYRSGDWVAWGPLFALQVLGKGRVCLVATGESACAIRALWQLSKLVGSPGTELEFAL